MLAVKSAEMNNESLNAFDPVFMHCIPSCGWVNDIISIYSSAQLCILLTEFARCLCFKTTKTEK